MRKEDIFSVALKLYSISLMLFNFANYTHVKVYIWSEEMHKELWTPYNMWMIMSWLIVFSAIYIWYRANKMLVTHSSIDFKSGVYLFLGFYWSFVGIYQVHRFVISTYVKHQNQFSASFGFDLFFEGLGVFMVGGVVLGYWLRKIDKVDEECQN